MRSWWQEKHNEGIVLMTVTNIGWRRRHEYRNHMEERHPWLRLCADHWKVDMLWKNHFSLWSPAPDPAKGKAREGSSGARRKCSLEEDEAGPSSKKVRFGSEEPVCKARPQPKKIVPMVSLISHINYVITHHHNSSTHCSYLLGVCHIQSY